MHPKDGRLECEAVLRWVRQQRCAACVEEYLARLELGKEARRVLPGAEAHHYPPKGMGGARLRDDHTIPLCSRHHHQAQTYVIPKSTQERWVMETRVAFIERASTEEIRLYVIALERWKERPMWVPS